MKTITITRDDMAKAVAMVFAKNENDMPAIVAVNFAILSVELIQELFGKEEDETCQKLS